MIALLLMIASAQDTTSLTIVAAAELALAHYPTIAVARARAIRGERLLLFLFRETPRRDDSRRLGRATGRDLGTV